MTRREGENHKFSATALTPDLTSQSEAEKIITAHLVAGSIVQTAVVVHFPKEGGAKAAN
jgi:hypothetical protein